MGGDFELAEIHKLYRGHDPLLEHKPALFDRLTGRWHDLFNARFDLSLYDLTSTYFEAGPRVRFIFRKTSSRRWSRVFRQLRRQRLSSSIGLRCSPLPARRR